MLKHIMYLVDCTVYFNSFIFSWLFKGDMIINEWSIVYGRITILVKNKFFIKEYIKLDSKIRVFSKLE